MMAIKFLSLGWETTLKRYFLMMFLVITGVLAKSWIITFLALPVFFTAILGVKFEFNTKKKAEKSKSLDAKMVTLSKKEDSDRKVG